MMIQLSSMKANYAKICNVQIQHYLCVILLLLLINHDYSFTINRITTTTLHKRPIPSSTIPRREGLINNVDSLPSHYQFVLYARRQQDPGMADQLQLFEDYDDDDEEYGDDNEELPDANDIKFHTNAVENNE